MPIIKEPIKECPFCHMIPILSKAPLWRGSHGYQGCYSYSIACQNDDCKINPATRMYDTVNNRTEQDCIDRAIADWNER